ncbi:hypothetical protein [Ornithinimicrobium humiphilum]|uniref:hypothetical protein n=1 Tax=Ornithinimicrobium humiphilum TaxID=125288 RepID=UPI00114E149A|nr:hypothetical protein [Ornithinimicrobium humiphilum]
MTDVNAAARAAREAHRDPRGRFGTQPATEADIDLAQDDQTDWRHVRVVVMGRSFTLGDVPGGRLYHGTARPLTPGEELRPGASPANHAQSAHDAVSLTSDPAVANFWARQAAQAQGLDPDQAVVLEVEPVGDVTPWRTCLADQGRSFDLLEARAPSARVLGPRTVQPA